MLTSEAPVTQPNNISGMLAPQTGFTASVIPQESRVATTDVLGNPLLQSGPPAIFASQVTQFTAQEARPIAPTNPQTTQPNLLSQSGLQAPPMEVTACTSSLTPVKAVSSKDKFETKSTVWADTLSRGLVNLNISGCKCLVFLTQYLVVSQFQWADTLSRGLHQYLVVSQFQCAVY